MKPAIFIWLDGKVTEGNTEGGRFHRVPVPTDLSPWTSESSPAMLKVTDFQRVLIYHGTNKGVPIETKKMIYVEVAQEGYNDGAV